MQTITTENKSFNYKDLEDIYQSWDFDAGPFSFETVVLSRPWNFAPSLRQFRDFTHGISTRYRCIHCGRVYEPMTAEEGNGSVCAGCGGEQA